MGEKEFFQRLLAISNEGLNYSKDPYDIERYNNLFDITQKIYKYAFNTKTYKFSQRARLSNTQNRRESVDPRP
ncbi:NUDIX hydrolase N-terminal domain-containing protein [Staphylococcus nepalensis]|uniref:NUDIX hydrolase N-terminal domain-containing protein n=1 Tax=Staphylococcus nepalensis TaxID=214473 RepID=A0ABS3L091_9STAP|nr:NUDIX hydrolase N-terminal domain-containing protein [Staphylococcus nepalensis]MBO1216526.1 NUDIX hydrolase N-terminal domain-containing protein [Staphylococcus nepalensis]MBO1226468.1 NUDIX hydrolase N-terminal domain-containing protein [Staphylococcus nepalensis]MBO1233672.1 NUDIX hydrolase N-terminal domain-containing protein [Staphylococcus nepalensis]